MYLAVAEKQGADWKKSRAPAERHPEGIHRAEGIHLPPEPSMRLVIDTFEFGMKHTPKFNVISISGYHIREAGSTAIQELAFTLRDGMEYVEWPSAAVCRSMIHPATLLLLQRHNDFFEEIAKYRAARRIWHKGMKERYKSVSPRSWRCVFTRKQPAVP